MPQPWLGGVVAQEGTYSWTSGTRSTRRTLFTRSALCTAREEKRARWHLALLRDVGQHPRPPSPRGTYRRTRWALETGEASVTLHASVTLLASFTFVTTGTLGTLLEEEEVG